MRVVVVVFSLRCVGQLPLPLDRPKELYISLRTLVLHSSVMIMSSLTEFASALPILVQPKNNALMVSLLEKSHQNIHFQLDVLSTIVSASSPKSHKRVTEGRFSHPLEPSVTRAVRKSA